MADLGVWIGHELGASGRRHGAYRKRLVVGLFWKGFERAALVEDAYVHTYVHTLKIRKPRTPLALNLAHLHEGGFGRILTSSSTSSTHVSAPFLFAPTLLLLICPPN